MHDPGVHSCGHMKGKVLEKLVLREGWSRVHAHVDVKGNVLEKLVLREGWCRSRDSFTGRYEQEGLGKIGLKRGVVQYQGVFDMEISSRRFQKKWS